MRAAPIIILLCLGGGSGASAQTSQPTPELIQKLGSSNFAVRDKATMAIEAVGAPALPALRESLKSAADLETRRRIEQLIRTIEDRQMAERLLKPTQVRLNVKNANAPDAVAEFAKKTGCPIHLSKEASASARLVTLDTGETIFWDAYAKLCDAAGLVEDKSLMGPFDLAQRFTQTFPRNVFDAGGGIHLVSGKPNHVPTFIAGSVRVRVAHISAAPGGGVDVFLDFSAEPKLDGLEPAGGLEAKATDGTGRILKQVPAEQLTAAEAGLHRMLARRSGVWMAGLMDGQILMGGTLGVAPPVGEGPFAMRVRLQPADKNLRAIKSLAGKVVLKTNVAAESVAVEKILAAAGRSATTSDGSKLTVRAVDRVKNGDLRLEVLYERPLDTDMVGTNSACGKARHVYSRTVKITSEEGGKLPVADAPLLIGADGKAWQLAEWTCQGWELFPGRATHRMGLVYRPGKGSDAPSQLILRTKRAFPFEVSFRFSDLQLPFD